MAIFTMHTAHIGGSASSAKERTIWKNEVGDV
jgi:hypothetical protein